MKVFLSWSGETSRQVALTLREWLPSVIQAIVPWMSSEDIEKGARWSSSISKELANISAGIVCVTPENYERPWLNFEAGALSKSVNQEMVCTYLFGLKPVDVTGPLSEFQHTLATKDETRKLLGTLNKAMNDKALTEGKLSQAFDVWWPSLEKSLASIPASVSTKNPARPSEEMIEEILNIVREQARTTQKFMSDLQWAEMQKGYYTSLYSNPPVPPRSVALGTLLTGYPVIGDPNPLDHLAPMQMSHHSGLVDYDADPSDGDNSPTDLDSTIGTE
jgi:hypothetical protein